MKYKNIFLGVIIIGLMIASQVINERKFETIINNQESDSVRDSITNQRITKFNRQNSTDFVQMWRKDYCETVREHIRKTHTPNHLTCKYLKK